MGEAPSPAPAPALWNWDYLDRCFARHRVCISFGLWICASSCWIAVHALLLYLRCGRKSGRDQSALWAACCLLISLCDTIGAILAKQLTIQVFTGAYLAAVDLLNFVSVLFPVCGSKFKSNSGRGSRERKRRRRLQASVFALVLPLSLGPGWALWAATPWASGHDQGPQRRLLGILVQDNTEILGFLLGGIAALGSWVSRIPPLSRILWRPQAPSPDGPHSPRRFQERVLPCLFRLQIIFLSCVMRSKMRQVLGFASEAGENPDTQALLTCAEKEEENQEAMTENLDWVPLTTLPHCKPFKRMAAISRYMELTIEPVQQVSCSASRLPGDGQTSTGAPSLQEPPSYPPVQVIQARVSSSSSSQVSCISSDLEQKYWEALISEQWDPEDVNLGGNKDSMDTLRAQAHRWSVKPVDLPSDEEHFLEPTQQLRAQGQAFVRN
ncbi:transmembrane protein 44 isoform X4 [Moschus berezovskii]|uniref:transmembrane protein 44 isoform X4 n=1 Tax=Moschus berezovskii TaxID=68408 RepID=UPI002443E0BF|nr:transmembrane protein 44 isoform X4 [Moschus berezovskii]